MLIGGRQLGEHDSGQAGIGVPRLTSNLFRVQVQDPQRFQRDSLNCMSRSLLRPIKAPPDFEVRRRACPPRSTPASLLPDVPRILSMVPPSENPPASTPSSTRPKRARAETQSQATDPQVAPASAGSPTRRPAQRRRQEADAAPPSQADASANALPEGEDAAADAEATDGGVAAARARVRRAGQSRQLTAEQKRARFLEKYSGKTPEQILGESSDRCLTARLANTLDFLDAVSKGWRSRVYEHFKAPIVVRGANGVVMHRFICKK